MALLVSLGAAWLHDAAALDAEASRAGGPAPARCFRACLLPGHVDSAMTLRWPRRESWLACCAKRSARLRGGEEESEGAAGEADEAGESETERGEVDNWLHEYLPEAVRKEW